MKNEHLDRLNAQRKPRLSRQLALCDCPQCRMAAAQVADSINFAASYDEALYDEMDDENFTAFATADFDDSVANRPARSRRKQREQVHGVCSCTKKYSSACDCADTANDDDDFDVDNEWMMLGDGDIYGEDDDDLGDDDFDDDDLDDDLGDDDFDDDLDDDDLNDEDLDDDDEDNLFGDDAHDDAFMAMDELDDDVDDEDYDSNDESFMAFEEDDDLDDDDVDDDADDDEDDDVGDDVDDVDDDSTALDWREPVWRSYKNRSGDRIPFSEQEKKLVRNALKFAHCLARQARRTFDTIWRQSGRLGQRWRRRRAAWRRHPDIVAWFGGESLSRAQIRRTRRRVHKIERILARRRIRFVKIQHQNGRRSHQCKHGNTRSAYVIAAGGLRRIFICPDFFSHDTASRARTLIHELVHEIGFCHYNRNGRPRCRRPGVGTLSDARYLARRHPRKARKNPYNYSQLFQALGRGRC